MIDAAATILIFTGGIVVGALSTSLVVAKYFNVEPKNNKEKK